MNTVEAARPVSAQGIIAQRPRTEPLAAIVQVVLSLSPGGTERLVIEICRRLSHEFRFSICCLDEEGEWAREVLDAGIEVVSLRRGAGFQPSLGRRIAAFADRCRARVLHCHHYTPFVYGRIATLWRPRLGVVFTEHGRVSDDPPSGKRRLVNPLLGRMPASIYAVSSDLRRHMIAEGFPAARVAVASNGIDPGPVTTAASRQRGRARLSIAADRYVIGTVARLDPVKDLLTLVKAFAVFRRSRRDALLVIVGDGPERSRVIAAVRAEGVSESVLLTGARNDVRELLPAFDVYVNSSITEGLSVTILEAMASSLPVVATGVGGNPEAVTHGETGLLVPPREPSALAAALVELAAAPIRSANLGCAGRRRLEERFTLDGMANRYAQAYRVAGRSVA